MPINKRIPYSNASQITLGTKVYVGNRPDRCGVVEEVKCEQQSNSWGYIGERMIVRVRYARTKRLSAWIDWYKISNLTEYFQQMSEYATFAAQCMSLAEQAARDYERKHASKTR